MLHGSPLLISDLLIDSDLNLVISYINLEKVQQALRIYGDQYHTQADPSAHGSPVKPGDQMLLEAWRDKSPDRML